VTLVPLDATNTILINKKFFDEFQNHQSTYEAQYCFKSLKMARHTWFNDEFYTVCVWDKLKGARVPPSGGPQHGRTRSRGARRCGRVCSSVWVDLSVIRLIINDEDGHNNHFDNPGGPLT
jgi:hypothetical protein